MSEPFLSEIKIMSFNFPPKGWAFCNGQVLPINQNQALFSLLGTTYGGNGQTTFGLPNLRGRTPIHFGNGHTLGEAAGSTAVTINIQQMPAHNHFFNTVNTSTNGVPAASTSTYLGQSVPADAYQTTPTNLVTASAESITNTGGSQPHNNMMPYLVLNFCIALQGIFPSQN
ncbi:MAG: phage tail protein [Saprospiraceae bacterium]